MEYLNVTLYACSMIYAYKRRFDLISIIIHTFLFVAATLGIVYYNSDVYRTGLDSISFMPFFYLWVSFMILLYPLNTKQYNVEILSIKNTTILNYVFVFYSIIAIIPFIEVSIYLFHLISSGTFFVMAENYDDLANGLIGSTIDTTYSFVGKKLLVILNWSRFVLPILFFCNCIINGTRKKFVFVGLLVAMIVPSLHSMTQGSRNILFFSTAYIFLLFLFLRKAFATDTYKTLKMFLFIGGCLVAFGVLALTIGRFILGAKYGFDTVEEALYQYTAESVYNFNNQLWASNVSTDAFYTFLEPCNKLFGTNFINPLYNTNVKFWYFYSAPGFFYTDFGLIGSLIFMVILSKIICKYKIKNDASISFHSLIIWGMYLHFIGGCLFYNNVSSAPETLLFSLIFIFFSYRLL